MSSCAGHSQTEARVSPLKQAVIITRVDLGGRKLFTFGWKVSLIDSLSERCAFNLEEKK